MEHGVTYELTYSWDEEPTDKLPIRVDQLKFRIREIYEAFKSFKAIVQGDQGETVSIDNFSQWSSFKGQVNCSKVLLTGHSFGGATSVGFQFVLRSTFEDL